MRADCVAVAGIGINFDRATLEKFKLGELWNKFEDSGDKHSFLEKLIENVEHILCEYSGSAYSGDIDYHLFAKDPIWGVADFLSDLQLIGFVTIDKTDLIFIEETLWS